MPANLTPQYLAAEQRYKQASSSAEKLEALEEMLAVIPKHKGTEKLQADLKRRMAKLNAEAGKKHGVSKASARYTVRREGAGQAVLIGAPNVGKSSLLAAVTHATPEIADYPFTTRLPQPGMMPFENVQVQIVDLPPVAPEFYEGWIGAIIRSADLGLLVVDLGNDDLFEEIDGVTGLLRNSRILLGRAGGPSGTTPDEGACVPSLLVATKADAPRAPGNLDIVREFYGSAFEIYAVSASTRQGLEELKAAVFEKLDVVRIHTKAPGKKADLSTPPFVLKSGSTVLDVARAVHRDLVHTLRFARVWSSDASHRHVKFSGQMVERTHKLEDGDIVELHG